MNKVIDADILQKQFPDAILRSGTVIYEGSTIGQRLVTGHNVVIRERNIVGDDVLIGVNSYLGPDNVIGNNVRIHTNCFLEGVVLEDNVIVAPHVVFTNDPHPPCKVCVKKIGGAKVGKNSVIGANATILPGVIIGKDCLIGAGSVVTKNIEDNTVYVGNPARKLKMRHELQHSH